MERAALSDSGRRFVEQPLGSESDWFSALRQGLNHRVSRRRRRGETCSPQRLYLDIGRGKVVAFEKQRGGAA
jgi:hypothetical protein